jgi:hypothetical protein
MINQELYILYNHFLKLKIYMLKEEHYYHTNPHYKLSNMSHEMNGFNSPKTSPESDFLSPSASEH